MLQLEQAAMDIRYLAKSNSLLAVSVTQAGATAEDKVVLTMEDVDFSKTGIPAMADVMLGIGGNQSYIKTDKRMVTFCKNKITGEHAKIVVSVDRAISKINDI